MTTVHDMPDSREAIAARLKRLREALGLSQVEMAAELDLSSQQAWANYEGNKRPLPYPIAIRFAQIWGIPLDWTYRGLIGMVPSQYADALRDAPAKGSKARA